MSLTILDANSVSRYLKTTLRDGELIPHHNVDALPLQHIDSFSRLRVSNPAYRFDSQLTYQIDTDLWDVEDNSGNGSVTHDSTERWAAMSADDSVAGNTIVLQSHYHAPYTPGHGMLAFITFLFGDALTEGVRKVGLFDGSNGIYLKETSDGLAICLDTTTSHTDQAIAQANWNLDTLDGNGPSGITLDTTKVQILVIQLQALYVGRVVVGFDIDGEVVPVHQFVHANEIAYTYIAQASLPVRYELYADSTTGAVTMKAICASVISEGGEKLQDMDGREFAAGAFDTTLSTPASDCVLAIQCKQQLNSINQNAVVVPLALDMTVETAGVWVEVYYNSTYTATPTWTSVSADSVMNYATDAAISAAGRLVDLLWVGADSKTRSEAASGLVGKVILAYSHLLGAGDSLAIAVTSAGSPDVWVSLKWKEIR